MGIFYDNSAKNDEQRLRQVLIADKHFNPQRLKEVIKSDVYNILKDYATLSSDNIYIDIDFNNNGTYHLKIDAELDNMKIFGSLPDEYV